MKQRLGGAALLVGAWITLAAPASAHPLGNFTINHYSGVRVAPDSVLVDHVLDLAEIPTFSERAAMDADGDGDVSDAETAAYRASACDRASEELQLTVDGAPAALHPIQSGLSFPQGQGASTLRLVCVLRADVSGTTFTFSDRSYAQRIGWREIVVQGDGMQLIRSEE